MNHSEEGHVSPARECEKKGQTNVSDIKNKGERQGERERQAVGGSRSDAQSKCWAGSSSPGGRLTPPWAFVSRAPALALQGQNSTSCLPTELGTAMGRDVQGEGGTPWEGSRQGSMWGGRAQPPALQQGPQSNTWVTRKAQPCGADEGICWGHQHPCQEA